MKILRNYKNVEFTIYLIAALTGIGLVMIYSTQMAGPGMVNENFTFIFKHLLWILIGVAALIVMSKIDYHYLQRYDFVLLVAGVVVLALVMIPGIGTEVNGARRWLRLGHFFGFQPSDVAKICMLVFVSSYIVRNKDRMHEFARGFIIPFVIVGVYLALLLVEPDFGTTVFLLLLSAALLVIGGTRIIYMFFALIAVTPYVHKMIYEVSYRKDRLMAFLDPWKDPSDSGYQIIQSLIALGSGGLFGKGLGASRQKLYFLPESSNDFILTIIGEETGFVGIVVVTVLFGLFVWNGIKICKASPDLFGFLLAFGITLMIGLQAAINIAVVSGSVPTKGIPLPFISAGGSSLVIFMLSIGILINIGKQGRKKLTIDD
ncbi:MAG: putative lipid II flippase FtsW [Candidatus Anammoxibacter sp.]